jgi:hypothetical protein
MATECSANCEDVADLFALEDGAEEIEKSRQMYGRKHNYDSPPDGYQTTLPREDASLVILTGPFLNLKMLVAEHLMSKHGYLLFGSLRDARRYRWDHRCKNPRALVVASAAEHRCYTHSVDWCECLIIELTTSEYTDERWPWMSYEWDYASTTLRNVARQWSHAHRRLRLARGEDGSGADTGALLDSISSLVSPTVQDTGTA